MAAEDVARDQRGRLCEAMAELVAARGYSAVRISDLTALAGVSRPTFYELFDDKEACFLATYDEIATDAVAALVPSGQAAGHGGALRLALDSLAALAAARPEQVSLLLLGALGAGPAAGARREQTLRTLSRSFLRLRSGDSRAGSRAGAARTPARRARPSASERLVAAMVLGGIREVTASRLRRGAADELASLTGDLADWASCYPLPPPRSLEPPADAAQRRTLLAAASTPRFPRTAAPGERLPSGHHNLSARFVALNQRERILDAVAAATAADGYAGLAIPTIAKLAHVSHQTFYEHFPTKQAAFLAAVKVGSAGLLQLGSEAFTHDTEWPEAVVIGTHALLRGVAAEPEYTRLGMVDALAAGPEALDLREAAMLQLAALLDPGRALAEASGRAVPAITAEAIVGGIWQAIHLEVLARRSSRLPLLAPLLAHFALLPYLGAKEALRHARRKPPR